MTLWKNQLPHWNEQRYPSEVFKEESLLWFSWDTARLFTAGTYSEYSQTIMNTIIFAIIGASLIVVFGMAGQLTLGHTIFVAAGVFLSANITTVWTRGLETELPIAFGVAFGSDSWVPEFTCNELYLALATFAYAFVGVQVLFSGNSFQVAVQETL